MKLEDRILELETINMELRLANAQYAQQIKQLEEKVMLLMKLLEKKSVKKDSHNSSNPPSQDKSKPKRTNSLRKKSGKKSGGQKGHKGHTLLQKEDVDLHIDLKSNFCECCGDSLPEGGHELHSRRQVVEIPPVVPLWIEYRQFVCTCLNCKHKQKADYPTGINAPVQYGASLVAMISYLSVYQYVPFYRLKVLLKDLFNISLSEGSIDNILKRGAKKSLPVYEAIHKEIEFASQVGADETGAKVNGDKWWIWVWQNVSNTFLKASDNRGSKTIDEAFPNGLPNATMGSDRWAAQLKTKTKNKQLCLPHLQRESTFLEEKEDSSWATYFKKLMREALDLRKLAEERGYPYHQGNSVEAYKLEHRLNRLLARSIDKEQFPETLKLQNSMIKHRNYILTFLYNLEVPPDNNGSERAIRNVKVKQKISGQYKSGQDVFCILRSVIDTLRKRELDIFTYLTRIMTTPSLV